MAKDARFLGVVFIACVMAGCLLPTTPRSVQVTPAPVNARAFSIFVGPPKFALYDPDCREDAVRASFGPGLGRELESALRTAGYALAPQSDKADITATLTYPVGDCHPGDGTVQGSGRPSVAFVYRHRVVHEAKGEDDDCNFNEEGRRCTTNWAARFVNGFTAALVAAALRPSSVPDAAAIDSITTSTSSTPARAYADGTSPHAGQASAKAYALVIGIEKYRDGPSPAGARSDAERFADLARSTLGVPPDHVILRLDETASKTDLEKELTWLSNNVPEGGRVYFYFAGNGAADASTRAPFLLPYDGDAQSVGETGLDVSSVMARLSETKAQEVVAFVDTCYSGAGGRSVLPKRARPPVRIVEPKASTRVALFSSAGASEVSGQAPGRNEGLFTAFVLEGLGTGAADLDRDGNVELGELVQWVSPRVTEDAKKSHREQHPTLTIGANVGDPTTIVLATAVGK